MKIKILIILITCFLMTELCSGIALRYDSEQDSESLRMNHIVIIIPSYNNALYYKANLDSVFMQDYSNYSVIYIDDCSTDGTGDLVQAYIDEHGLHDKIIFIRNPENVKALANMYRAVHMCADQDIIVELDGDDAFAHKHVLSKINTVFSTQEVWLTYSQFINLWPDGKKSRGSAKPTPQEWVESREYRTKWIWSGTRAFYAWLYKQIKIEDLMLPTGPHAGKFFPVAKDGAVIYPMLEMAGPRFAFIDEVLLLRNFTPINDFRISKNLQVIVGDYLRSRPKYPLLERPVV